jgi:hypothetical protein
MHAYTPFHLTTIWYYMEEEGEGREEKREEGGGMRERVRRDLSNIDGHSLSICSTFFSDLFSLTPESYRGC